MTFPPNETQEKGAKKHVASLVFATLVLLAGLAAELWLLWLFQTIDFLPRWLTATLQILCIASVFFSVGFYKSYLSTRR